MLDYLLIIIENFYPFRVPSLDDFVDASGHFALNNPSSCDIDIGNLSIDASIRGSDNNSNDNYNNRKKGSDDDINNNNDNDDSNCNSDNNFNNTDASNDNDDSNSNSDSDYTDHSTKSPNSGNANILKFFSFMNNINIDNNNNNNYHNNSITCVPIGDNDNDNNNDNDNVFLDLKHSITGENEKEKEPEPDLESASVPFTVQQLDPQRKSIYGNQGSDKTENTRDEKGFGHEERGSGRGRVPVAVPSLRISETEYFNNTRSTCAMFDANFKEMERKKEICDKKNEHIIRTEWNTQPVKRVLIVDDSMLCQKIIIKVLDGANYLFETAGNGKEACDKIGE